jgi:hypothetical protein
MQAYRFNITISENGTISLPFVPALYGTDAELIIVPKEIEAKQEELYTMSDFLKEWSGAFADLKDEDLDKVKYDYLTEKYK